MGSQLALSDLASTEVKKELMAEKRHGESDDLRQLKQYSGVLIPWYNLWAKVILGKARKADLESELSDAQKNRRLLRVILTLSIHYHQMRSQMYGLIF